MANGGNRPNRPLRPRGGGQGGRRRRVVIDNQAARPTRDQRQARQDGQRREQRPQPVAPPTGPVSVESGISVRDLSQALGVPMPKIITLLMGLGQARTATQSLSDEEVELIAAEIGRQVTIKHAADEDEEPEAFDDPEEALEARPPVVTIMGHVDHGKTTLLDAIRNAKVVETEAGGITQHIGAYQVAVDGRRVTFLDTPGHEAFTAMRARGAKVTDIAVLVVAADDSVMPQTLESIAHARAAEVPIVVAVNKVDLPAANPDRVLADLAAQGLQPEEWGGDTQVARVSAKQETGLDDLLERILLVADAELDLRANPKAEASGPIVESRLDIGRGPVATMLVQRGTLAVGDAIAAGDAWGRVRALFNYKGEKLKEARPGDPVEILGFDSPPPAGELARVVENERVARDLAQKRAERLRREQLASVRPSGGVSLESLYEAMQAGEVQDLNLVLKGDVQGSVEAIGGELAKIQHPEVRVNVIHQGVGGITDNDVMLASASGGMVIGFNVRPNAETRGLAEREGVEIRTYDVIYKLTEDIEQALVGMLAAVTTEEALGEAEVRETFRASRVGTIAGCMVTNGVVRRGAQVRVIRDGTVVYTTTIDSLKRFQDDAREVAEGFECGIHLANFDDVKVGDVLEAFETREVERTSLDEPAA
ncbi:MAG TPA: translation initiation factor IF-2 [Gaiellaceae bacterium]|nr:translation initiation factor IF-2 [Gaiellaceae bacterium]